MAIEKHLTETPPPAGKAIPWLQEQAAKADEIKTLPYKHPDAKEWEMTTAAILKKVFGKSHEIVKEFEACTVRHLLMRPEDIQKKFIEKTGTRKAILESAVKQIEIQATQRDEEYSAGRPAPLRLYMEEIDSFSKVRDVTPESVGDLLQNGVLSRSEDDVQIALEEILDIPFHKKDWGGESNDLYTANLLFQGKRTATAFVLKGPGMGRRVTEIRDCGKNGDQLVRLVDSPAQLFIVQFVGTVSEMVIRDIEGKIRDLRNKGADAWYCIIDGQDTARLLRAYGKV